MNEEALQVLACPHDHTQLHLDSARKLTCEAGHEFPIIDGVPVLLPQNVEPTMDTAAASLIISQQAAAFNRSAPDLYLGSLGISDVERTAIDELSRSATSEIDPVVQYLIAATCGTAYKSVTGKLTYYPIPNIPLPKGEGRFLLDVGCNWGRWSISASRKGYRVIGLDPQLGAVVAASRISKKLALPITYLCGDARFLPLHSNRLDVVYSYSVLQHLSPHDCRLSLQEAGRVLAPGGRAVIQMANIFGVRNLYQLTLRGLRRGRGIEVRYYRPAVLERLFRSTIGETSLSVDCFLGLGLQETDIPLLTGLAKTAAICSAALKRASALIPGLAVVADSLFVNSTKGPV